jgi:hypothetical protein
MSRRRPIQRHTLLFYSFVCVLGIAVAVSGGLLAESESALGTVVVAIGTTICATSIFLVVQIFFQVSPFETHVSDAGSRLMELGLHDIHLHVGGDEHFYENFASSKSLDLLYNTGRNTIQRYQDLIERAIRDNGCRVRILVVSPDAKVLQDVANRNALCPGTNISGEVQDVLRFLAIMRDQLIETKTSKGHLECRGYQNSPLCSLAIVDDHFARYTPYLPYIHSSQVPIYDINKRGDGLFIQYKNAFDRLWANSRDDVLLVFDPKKDSRLAKQSTVEAQNGH